MLGKLNEIMILNDLFICQVVILFYLNLFINYHFILIIKYFIASLNLFFHLIQQNFVFLLIYDINHYLLDYIQSYIHLNSWYNFIHNFLQVKLNEVQILNILYTCQVIQVLSLFCCIFLNYYRFVLIVKHFIASSNYFFLLIQQNFCFVLFNFINILMD